MLKSHLIKDLVKKYNFTIYDFVASKKTIQMKVLHDQLTNMPQNVLNNYAD